MSLLENAHLVVDQSSGRQPATWPATGHLAGSWVRGLDSNQRHLGWQPRVPPLNYPGMNLLRCFRTRLYHGMVVCLVGIKAPTISGTPGCLRAASGELLDPGAGFEPAPSQSQ